MEKSKIAAGVLAVVLMLSGCGSAPATVTSGDPNMPVPGRPDSAVGAAEETNPSPVASVPNQGSDPAGDGKPAELSASTRLTKAQAQSAALKHAGFRAEQVKGLKSEFDVDNGIPHYEVEFRVGQWEYEYDIHAQTGAVLSFEKED